jgi:hypothetical protein
VTDSIVIYPDLGRFDRGRLGNQLWQIAGTFGIAASCGADVRFPDWSYRDHFSIPARDFTSEPLVGVDASTVPQHIRPRHRPYLQDAGLWRAIEPTIRTYFAPSVPTRTDLENRFAAFLDLPEKTAVHVRRGDYLDIPQLLPVPTEAYFRAALGMLAETNVVVFSDDIPWCREHLSWANPVVFMEGDTDYEDLFLMAKCDHHVISNSTFSWWGAFLSGNPHPVYPLTWYGSAFPDAKPGLMFLDGWVGVGS